MNTHPRKKTQNNKQNTHTHNINLTTTSLLHLSASQMLNTIDRMNQTIMPAVKCSLDLSDIKKIYSIIFWHYDNELILFFSYLNYGFSQDTCNVIVSSFKLNYILYHIYVFFKLRNIFDGFSRIFLKLEPGSREFMIIGTIILLIQENCRPGCRLSDWKLVEKQVIQLLNSK